MQYYISNIYIFSIVITHRHCSTLQQNCKMRDTIKTATPALVLRKDQKAKLYFAWKGGQFSGFIVKIIKIAGGRFLAL